MTDQELPPDMVDDGASDVLAEDEVVHVPPSTAELAESIEHHGETFVADVPDWDNPDT
jgi:hypothetical protein